MDRQASARALVCGLQRELAHTRRNDRIHRPSAQNCIEPFRDAATLSERREDETILAVLNVPEDELLGIVQASRG